jgi:hypothetical protein
LRNRGIFSHLSINFFLEYLFCHRMYLNVLKFQRYDESVGRMSQTFQESVNRHQAVINPIKKENKNKTQCFQEKESGVFSKWLVALQNRDNWGRSKSEHDDDLATLFRLVAEQESHILELVQLDPLLIKKDTLERLRVAVNEWLSLRML